MNASRCATRAHVTRIHHGHQVGPDLCALVRPDDSSQALAERLDKYLNELYYNPIPIPHGYRPGILTSGHARSKLSTGAKTLG